ncbi:hypothetical protein ES288_A07G045000v1 [Gossypium darwinii]|uniref:Auxin-responsive protein n=1 Tax=Gossypium darwinii TaxID=34276 RepID=A0A5D2FTD4_GOSDA|nr:hypothetical protein ES288_A07G045000v1 [Gossypium darwinii]
MELQLGLSLPSTPIFPFKMLDLNSYGYELREGLGPFGINVNNNCGSCSSSCNSSSSGGADDGGGGTKTRRLLDEENRIVPKTLPLLFWTNQRPNDEDEPKDVDDHSSSAIFKNDGEGLVGWPPVKAWRKKVRRRVANVRAAVENSCGGRASSSTYVKVKMEGNAIARKIDISLHHSFESLTTTLMRMFDISDENGQKSFKLTYLDREGDWLLAEDVRWRNFIRSLKYIKLIRSRC